MKVLVNGCSHVEGTGLHNDEHIRRTLTWPNYIKYWSVRNIANAASSNDSICRRTIDFLDQTPEHFDFVYIQWSYFDRVELQIPFWQEHELQQEWFCINPGNAHQKIPLNGHEDYIYNIARSLYLKQFNQTWLYRLSLMSMTTLYYYLSLRNINFKFGFSRDTLSESDTKWFNPSQIVNQPWVQFCNAHHFKLVDGGHYELSAHRSYCKYIENLTV